MESLEQVKKLFDQNSLKISGVIFNKAPMTGSSYYNSYYYNDNDYDGKKKKK